jgi:hypothetical protein
MAGVSQRCALHTQRRITDSSICASGARRDDGTLAGWGGFCQIVFGDRTDVRVGSILRKSRIEHIWSGMPQIATINAVIA